ncbi:NAD(P)-binding protein [Delitschia confertaspora ATCC 74209]|uniref:NAD(P)-binding protein n=1 Tax=Delitschia confertaspora ATCC 74209 TaxID=1513339 RepID=A0A9P4JP25_9PLEO|nr:NAD(P)-binding protein [Delitschia confertaspora ATCC 74209]
MQPPYPSFTPTWRNDVYPAIDPTQPELSQAGKTVIITGAGSGIGRETAIAFATAGAKHVALLGRTSSTLLETQKLISESSTTASVYPVDVTDEARVKKVAEAVGNWDILILNAGHISAPAYIAQSSVDEYWKNYETNVKSILIAASAFFPTAVPSGAAVYAVTAGALVMPPKMTAGLSGYLTSKLAQIKIMEYLAVENPNMFFSTVHPGMIDTGIFRASGASPESLPMDTAKLPAHFFVWLSQPKNKYLNGRFIWANWDVEELEKKAAEIENSTDLTIGYQGWPFT